MHLAILVLTARRAQFVDGGSWVWYKHEELAWAPCKVVKGGRDVELENGETHERYQAEGVQRHISADALCVSQLTPCRNDPQRADVTPCTLPA